MRFMIKVVFPIENGNRTVRDGSLPKRLQEIMAEIKPEAAYFTTEHGKRGGTFIVNIDDASQMPSVAEPFFLAFNAEVKFLPVMTPEDLAKGDLTGLAKRWA
jgi:hypothetical protein